MKQSRRRPRSARLRPETCFSSGSDAGGDEFAVFDFTGSSGGRDTDTESFALDAPDVRAFIISSGTDVYIDGVFRPAGREIPFLQLVEDGAGDPEWQRINAVVSSDDHVAFSGEA